MVWGYDLSSVLSNIGCVQPHAFDARRCGRNMVGCGQEGEGYAIWCDPCFQTAYQPHDLISGMLKWQICAKPQLGRKEKGEGLK